MTPRLAGWLALATLVAILDQGSKHWVMAVLDFGDSVPVTGFSTWYWCSIRGGVQLSGRPLGLAALVLHRAGLRHLRLAAYPAAPPPG